MYPSYEILIIENNSTEEATFSYYKELEAQGIRVLKYPKQGFNYSAINNFGVKEAKGEYLLFLNNDMEIITPDFIEKMVSNLQRPQIGAVGGPRCCKRDSFLAIREAIGFVKEHFGIEMEQEDTVCRFYRQNAQCVGRRCPFSAANHL